MLTFFKEKNPGVKVWVIDPAEIASTALFINNDRTSGTIENGNEMLPVVKGSSIAEGVAALARVTSNLREAIIDKGITGTNQEIVDMAYFLLRHDGIFVGPSSALNVLGAVKMAKELGPGHTIVTILLTDGGARYVSKLYNEKWLEDNSLLPRDASVKKDSVSLEFARELTFPTTL